MSEDNGGYEYAIESVENAARVLLMLRSRPAVRVVDVARELGVARSTAHRMVTTLAHSGLLRRGEDGKAYSAGYALVELGIAVIGAADIRTEVTPFLRRLAAETGETAHFLMRDGDEVVFVAAVEGTHVIRAAARVGTRVPAHVTSAGKCLLAAAPREEVLRLYPEERLPQGGTDAAITTRAQLLSELDATAQKGWAVNRSESEPGLVAVSVSVRDDRGLPLGAISVSGPTERFEQRIAQTVETMRSAIADLERALGGRR